MKILIPTAKEMVLTQESDVKAGLDEKVVPIIEALGELSVPELMALYHIKEEAAQKEFERIQQLVNGTAKQYPAIALFNGLMYRSMGRSAWSQEMANYMAQNVYITSALYGVIGAYDLISPHRLDFQNRLSIEGVRLKNYWESAYQQAVKDEEVVISLLSSEFEQVFPKASREKMIKISFVENGKTHSTISKKARGQFLEAMAKRQVMTVETIKTLHVNGFVYQEKESTQQQLIFVK